MVMNSLTLEELAAAKAHDWLEQVQAMTSVELAYTAVDKRFRLDWREACFDELVRRKTDWLE